MSGIDEDWTTWETMRAEIVGFWSAVLTGPLVDRRGGCGETDVDEAVEIVGVVGSVDVVARVGGTVDGGGGGEGVDDGSNEDIVDTGGRRG